MNLFRLGDFILRSGRKSGWKVECESLTPEDWAALALMASEILPPFGAVEGVPRGGIPFADALAKYITPSSTVLLLAEDIWTTGGSMNRYRNGRDAIGVVFIARGSVEPWVTPLLVMNEGLWAS